MKTIKYLLPDFRGDNIRDGITPTPDWYEQKNIDTLTNAGYELEFAWREWANTGAIESDGLMVEVAGYFGLNNIIWNIREGRIYNVKMYATTRGDIFTYDGTGLFCPENGTIPDKTHTEYEITPTGEKVKVKTTIHCW